MVSPVETQYAVNTLKKYGTVFGLVNIETLYKPVDDNHAVEQLLCSLGQDYKNRDLVLQLMYTEDVIQAMGIEIDPEESSTLQFSSLLPLQASEETLSHVHELLAMLNRLLPIGGFGVDAENKIYFRYNLLNPDRVFHQAVLLEVYSMTRHFLLRLIPAIEFVIEGKKDVEQSLKWTETALHPSFDLSMIQD